MTVTRLCVLVDMLVSFCSVTVILHLACGQ